MAESGTIPPLAASADADPVPSPDHPQHAP